MGEADDMRCRQIGEADLGAVADLLARGFARRPRTYWTAGLDRLRERRVPEGYPRYGFLLEVEGATVGVVLLICQTVAHEGAPFVRCNLTSWYVEPAYRSHAALLSMMPLRYKAATFVNASPAPNTRATIEAQGFKRFTGGQLLALPLLARGGRGLRIEPFRPDDPLHAALPDAALLADHQATGCLSFVGSAPDASPCPFVFLPSRLGQGRYPFPGAQLVFCRALADVARFARPLGTELARLGRPVMVVDADGPVAGLPGVFLQGRAPKYFKGPHRPRWGDLAYTEFPLFGA